MPFHGRLRFYYALRWIACQETFKGKKHGSEWCIAYATIYIQIKYIHIIIIFSSVQFNHSVMLDSLWPHGLQHTRPPCLSPTPEVYPNSCPLSRWCHPNISSSVIPFSSFLWSFPASGSFQMSQFFVSGGQSIGVLASASILSMNIQDWFPLGLTGWVSLLSKGLSRVFSSTAIWKLQFFRPNRLLGPELTSVYDCWKNK